MEDGMFNKFQRKNRCEMFEMLLDVDKEGIIDFIFNSAQNEEFEPYINPSILEDFRSIIKTLKIKIGSVN
jgi:hypothetical protein